MSVDQSYLMDLQKHKLVHSVDNKLGKDGYGRLYYAYSFGIIEVGIDYNLHLEENKYFSRFKVYENDKIVDFNQYTKKKLPKYMYVSNIEGKNRYYFSDK